MLRIRVCGTWPRIDERNYADEEGWGGENGEGFPRYKGNIMLEVAPLGKSARACVVVGQNDGSQAKNINVSYR